MAILNGSYKFHTSPTNYIEGTNTIEYTVHFTDYEGTSYNYINFSYNVTTAIRNPDSFYDIFDTANPLTKNYINTSFDDIENAPWLILTFDNQEVDDLLYEIITNCADPYFDGILINITSPEGVTLATEKTIVNSNIKVTIDESLLGGGASGYPVEVSDSSIIINSTETGKIYKYIGETDNYCTNGYCYAIEEG